MMFTELVLPGRVYARFQLHGGAPPFSMQYGQQQARVVQFLRR